MKNLRIISFFLGIVMLISGCTSTTLIQSEPPSARIYIDGEYKGTTPYTHSDTKITGSATDVKLTKEGYEDFYTYFYRTEEIDVGAVIGGVFFLFPFLWTMKYRPSRIYELVPATEITSPEKSNSGKNIVAELAKLKEMLDAGLITREEFEILKKKLLEE